MTLSYKGLWELYIFMVYYTLSHSKVTYVILFNSFCFELSFA